MKRKIYKIIIVLFIIIVCFNNFSYSICSTDFNLTSDDNILSDKNMNINNDLNADKLQNNFEDVDINCDEIFTSQTEGETIITHKAIAAVSTHQESVQQVFNFATSFATNAAGTLVTIFLDGFLRIIDIFQMAANVFETLRLNTAADLTVVYDFDFLNSDASSTGAGAGNRNKFTEVKSGYIENDKSSWQTEEPINVDIANANTTETEYKFSRSTLIPVIPVDVFTIARGNIEIFDPNFLIVDTTIHNDPNSAWVKIRRLVTIINRSLIFITAALLVTGLIWHAIHIVWGSITPNQRRDHMAGIQRFATSLLLLIGTVIIIAIGVYVNKMLSKYNNIDLGHDELPIRVNVKEADYSFSTTKTGVIRYMAQIENPNLFGIKIVYTLEYTVLALINFVSAFFFGTRMFLMMFGAGYGIIAVAAQVLERENLLPLDYQHWLIWYIALALIQTIYVLAYSITNLVH